MVPGHWESVGVRAMGHFPSQEAGRDVRDIGAGLAACCEHQRQEYEQQITNLWDPSGHAMVTLSIRTGFDLLLQTLKLPAGSEVLCSAITIPDMIYVLRYHGLVPVPVDLDPETLALISVFAVENEDAVDRHIFGSRFRWMKRLELRVRTVRRPLWACSTRASTRADVSMFSFGTIKTATSFGGAIIHVKNSAVLEEMHRRERGKLSCFWFISVPHEPVLLQEIGEVRRAAWDFYAGNLRVVSPRLPCCWSDHIGVRGFSGGELVSLIQYRPSMALLGLMHRRLTCMDEQYVLLRKSKSEQLANAIKDLPNVSVSFIESHLDQLLSILTFSAFYVGILLRTLLLVVSCLCAVPQDVVSYMNTAGWQDILSRWRYMFNVLGRLINGFDVTSGATQLTYVPRYDEKGKTIILLVVSLTSSFSLVVCVQSAWTGP
ncbi:Pyridoxal phosphate-dependent transferase [Phytophthora cactorum]|nr:Pyridoxal phosphate-dependent transferase [Phytophthora cactorum]